MKLPIVGLVAAPLAIIGRAGIVNLAMSESDSPDNPDVVTILSTIAIVIS